jgi:hypothetical protein
MQYCSANGQEDASQIARSIYPHACQIHGWQAADGRAAINRYTVNQSIHGPAYLLLYASPTFVDRSIQGMFRRACSESKFGAVWMFAPLWPACWLISSKPDPLETAESTVFVELASSRLKSTTPFFRRVIYGDGTSSRGVANFAPLLRCGIVSPPNRNPNPLFPSFEFLHLSKSMEMLGAFSATGTSSSAASTLDGLPASPSASTCVLDALLMVVRFSNL